MTAAHDTQALTIEDVRGAIKAAYDAATASLFSGNNDPDAGALAALTHLTAALASRLQEQEGQPALSALLERAAWICECYSEFIRSDVMSADFARHPYLPEIDGTAEDLRATLAAGSQAVHVPAEKAQAARYEIGKWLNEGQLREINRQDLAELCAGFDQLDRAVQVPGWRPIDSAPKDFVTEFDGWNGERVPNVFWGHPEYEEKGALAWCVMRSDGQGSYRDRVLGLTHWMEIPAAPIQPLAGGEVG